MLQNQADYYQILFEESPIAIWVEDFSQVIQCVEKFKAEGVVDLRSYLLTYPAKAAECMNSLKVLDVNKSSLRLYKASDKQSILDNLPLIFRGEAKLCLMESIIALSEEKTFFSGYGVNYDLEGNKLLVRITWNIHSTYKHVIVMLQDCSQLEELRQSREESESLFRSIFEQSSDGLVLLDSEGTICLMNHAFSHIMKTQEYNLAGTSIGDVFRNFAQQNCLNQELLTDPDIVK